MSNKIGFNNFKAFGPQMQYFTKKPITLIYGQNSIGKSSLIHFLLFKNYMENFDDPDLISTDFFGDTLELGGFNSFVNQESIDKSLCYSIEIENTVPIINSFFKSDIFSLDKNDEVLIKHIKISQEEKDFFRKITSYTIDGEVLFETESVIATGQNAYNFTSKITFPESKILKKLNLKTIVLNINGTERFEKVTDEEIENLNSWKDIFCGLEEAEYSDSYAFHFSTFIAEKLLSPIQKKYEENIKPIQYLSPLRYYPSFNVAYQKNSSDTKYSKALSSKDMWSILAHEDNIERFQLLSKNFQINEALKKLEIPYKIVKKQWIDIDDINQFNEDKSSVNVKIELAFKDLTRDIILSNRNLGLGVSQVLPIVYSSVLELNSEIFIEQPELHLHPRVQCELADIFIKSMNVNNLNNLIPVIDLFDEETDDCKIKKNNNNTFVLETHSEHILLRIMKRIRQTNDGTLKDESLKLTPDDVCILYVDHDGKQTFIQELRLSRTGKLLDHWPNGFFEEGYKERFF